ncbi:helix-turn-helix domain-containing protein [Streptomyces hainanensis]|uniref:Helix-turn-helix domain-containing protein n=1 Tax=Streptomyces hainanensis TaxID=402648 RepID=A0A4R4T7Q2_9ACTN|nr:helix-turn-helix domain-containing protein [Streptomyces hainanensis]
MAERGAPMEDSAVHGQRPRAESRSPVIDQVEGGRLREGPEYATFRSRGTTDWLLIHTVAGSGQLTGVEGSVRTAVGDAVLLRPGVLHDYRTAPGEAQPEGAHWEIVFSHFHPRHAWLPLLDWPQPVTGVGRIRTRGEVHQRVAATLARSAQAGVGTLRQATAFAMNALEEALLWCDTQNPLTSRMDERLLRVIEHVDAHLAEPLTVDRLAASVHLSPSRLTRLFTEHLGTTPQRYVERQRMTLAKQLLDLTNRPVAAIARELGWRDPLYFTQRFRRFTGQSPTAYRRRR